MNFSSGRPVNNTYARNAWRPYTWNNFQQNPPVMNTFEQPAQAFSGKGGKGNNGKGGKGMGGGKGGAQMTVAPPLILDGTSPSQSQSQGGVPVVPNNY